MDFYSFPEKVIPNLLFLVLLQMEPEDYYALWLN